MLLGGFCLVALALSIAPTLCVPVLSPLRRRLTTHAGRLAARAEAVPTMVLRCMHSGLVDDYAAWLSLRLAGLAADVRRLG